MATDPGDEGGSGRAAPRERAARVRDLSGAVYGTIVTMSLLVVASAQEVSVSETLLTIVVTVVVLDAAHVYARFVAGALRTGEPVHRHLRDAFLHEWPLLQSAVLPCLLLLLGYSKGVSDSSAINAAMAAGAVSLFFWGLAIGRQRGAGRLGTLAVGLVNLAFAGALVAVFGLVH